MKPKQLFNWKFRLMQDIIVTALLALFLSSSAQAELNSLSCKMYLEASPSFRTAYVGGLIDGYALAARLLADMATADGGCQRSCRFHLSRLPQSALLSRAV